MSSCMSVLIFLASASIVLRCLSSSSAAFFSFFSYSRIILIWSSLSCSMGVSKKTGWSSKILWSSCLRASNVPNIMSFNALPTASSLPAAACRVRSSASCASLAARSAALRYLGAVISASLTLSWLPSSSEGASTYLSSTWSFSAQVVAKRKSAQASLISASRDFFSSSLSMTEDLSLIEPLSFSLKLPLKPRIRLRWSSIWLRRCSRVESASASYKSNSSPLFFTTATPAATSTSASSSPSSSFVSAVPPPPAVGALFPPRSTMTLCISAWLIRRPSGPAAVLVGRP
mmetsp:Transcript_83156/g.134836  ORF Transcript_83156/g.134836 Transcript_83156/m.134836 type:complete len:288 (-) Transcript_83156:91-954(-)